MTPGRKKNMRKKKTQFIDMSWHFTKSCPVRAVCFSVHETNAVVLFGSLPLFGSLDSPFAFPTWSEPHQSATELRPPVFKRSRVRLFGPQQSSNECSHHSEQTQPSMEADQEGFVYSGPNSTSVYVSLDFCFFAGPVLKFSYYCCTYHHNKIFFPNPCPSHPPAPPFSNWVYECHISSLRIPWSK